LYQSFRSHHVHIVHCILCQVVEQRLETIGVPRDICEGRRFHQNTDAKGGLASAAAAATI
jgi:hypothetical protein